MPKKRRPHDELVPEVIAAAVSAIEARGLAGLTARGLAGAVGVSVGTVYNLFGDLDGVVRAVNLTTLEELHETLSSALDGAGERIEDRLTAMANAYLDYARDHSGRWQALFQYRFSTVGDDPRIDAAEEKLLALLRGAAAGHARDDALRALWAAVHGVAELAMTRRLKGETGEAERRYAGLIVRAGLRGLAALDGEGGTSTTPQNERKSRCLSST